MYLAHSNEKNVKIHFKGKVKKRVVEFYSLYKSLTVMTLFKKKLMSLISS